MKNTNASYPIKAELQVKEFLKYVYDEKELETYINDYNNILEQKYKSEALKALLDFANKYSKVGSTILFSSQDKTYLDESILLTNSLEECLEYLYEISWDLSADDVTSPIYDKLDEYLDKALTYIEKAYPYEGSADGDIKKLLEKETWDY